MLNKILGLKENQSYKELITAFIYWLIISFIFVLILDYSTRGIILSGYFSLILGAIIFSIFFTLSSYSIKRAYLFGILIIILWNGYVFSQYEGDFLQDALRIQTLNVLSNIIPNLYPIFFLISPVISILKIVLFIIIPLAINFLTKVSRKSNKIIKIFIIILPFLILIIQGGLAVSTCAYNNDAVCVGAKAAKTNDLQLCSKTYSDRYGNPIDGYFECYFELAVKTKNSSLCFEQLYKQNKIKECFQETTNSEAEYAKAILDVQYKYSSFYPLWGTKPENQQNAIAFINCYDENNGEVEATIRCIYIQKPNFCNNNSFNFICLLPPELK